MDTKIWTTVTEDHDNGYREVLLDVYLNPHHVDLSTKKMDDLLFVGPVGLLPEVLSLAFPEETVESVVVTPHGFGEHRNPHSIPCQELSAVVFMLDASEKFGPVQIHGTHPGQPLPSTPPEDGTLTLDLPDDIDFDTVQALDACPGCGCVPGDGVTEGCDHPDGCGYYKPTTPDLGETDHDQSLQVSIPETFEEVLGLSSEDDWATDYGLSIWAESGDPDDLVRVGGTDLDLCRLRADLLRTDTDIGRESARTIAKAVALHRLRNLETVIKDQDPVDFEDGLLLIVDSITLVENDDDCTETYLNDLSHECFDGGFAGYGNSVEKIIRLLGLQGRN